LRVEKDVKAGARVEVVVCLQDRVTGRVECYGGGLGHDTKGKA